MSYRVDERNANARDPQRARRAAALSGIAVVTLFGAGNALWAFGMPDPGSSPAAIAAFYRETSGRIVAGASLSLAAIALFVFFASALRRVLTDAEDDRDELLGTTAFGGALLGAAAGLGAETINMAGALRAADGHLSPALGQSLFEISQVLGFNAAGVGIGVLALATAAAALRAGAIMPRWLAGVTIVLGLSLLTPASRLTLGPGVLLLVVIPMLLLRRRKAPPESVGALR